MRDIPLIPDDLATCQQLLRDSLAKLFAAETECEQACETGESLHAKLLEITRERDELKLAVERLLHRLYGRSSERHADAAGQLQLDFGDLPAQDVAPAAPEFEDVTIRRRKKGTRSAKPRSEELPAHLERREEVIDVPESERVG